MYAPKIFVFMINRSTTIVNWYYLNFKTLSTTLKFEPVFHSDLSFFFVQKEAETTATKVQSEQPKRKISDDLGNFRN